MVGALEGVTTMGGLIAVWGGLGGGAFGPISTRMAAVIPPAPRSEMAMTSLRRRCRRRASLIIASSSVGDATVGDSTSVDVVLLCLSPW